MFCTVSVSEPSSGCNLCNYAGVAFSMRSSLVANVHCKKACGVSFSQLPVHHCTHLWMARSVGTSRTYGISETGSGVCSFPKMLVLSLFSIVRWMIASSGASFPKYGCVGAHIVTDTSEAGSGVLFSQMHCYG